MFAAISSPYSSSRPGAPVHMQPSATSSPLYTSSAPGSPAGSRQPLPTTDTSRPSMCATSNTFDKPVSMLPYHDYTTNEPTVQHQIIDMPDQYEYSDPAVGRRNARNQAGQPQLSSQPVFYPLIEQNWHTTHDIYHGFSGFIHHPTAEDFLRADHPLPAPPNEVYDSDQNLPIIEPDSCLNGGLLDIRDTHDTNADFRTAVPAASIRRSSDHGGTFNRIQTMSSDTYHTALGGLRKISSGLHRKSSKRDRVKRFLKDMNPFRHRRDYGERASRTRDSIN